MSLLLVVLSGVQQILESPAIVSHFVLCCLAQPAQWSVGTTGMKRLLSQGSSGSSGHQDEGHSQEGSDVVMSDF